MNHPDYDFLITETRRLDDQARAEQQRMFLAAKAAARENRLPAAPRRIRPRLIGLSLRPLMLALAHGLGFLGDHLLTWSCQIQYRYRMASGAMNEAEPCR